MHDPDTLIQRYLEGKLDEAGATALHDLIRQTPELGHQLLDHFEMDALLRAADPIVQQPAIVSAQKRFSVAMLASTAALAAAVTLMGTWVALRWLPPDANKESTTAAVAVLTRGVKLVWDSEPAAPGTPLSPRWLKLKSGIAQVEFYTGARVVVEGPAQLQLISSSEAACLSGRLSAHVPPQAKGFRINTPKGTIVDLGTEFGLDVNDTGGSVHVFKGEVELHPDSASMQSLKEGQAMTLAAAPQSLPVDAGAFASLTELDLRTAESLQNEFLTWTTGNVRRNSHPALRLRFDFQDDEMTRTLHNHAANRDAAPDGSIVACSWTQGRWPGKKALEFSNVSDRVRVSVPGELKEFTMALWVRVSGLDRYFNGLFMSEGWGDRKVHWQILRDGAVRLGIAGTGKSSHQDCDTPRLFTAEKFGRWTHLAVVFDPDHKEVRQYADGVLVSRSPINDLSPAKPGIAELGNWNDRKQGPNVAIRHLSGAMDEFSLYDKVLDESEILALAGR